MKLFKMSRNTEKKIVQDVSLANYLVNHIQLATDRPTTLSKKTSQHYDIPRKTFS